MDGHSGKACQHFVTTKPFFFNTKIGTISGEGKLYNQYTLYRKERQLSTGIHQSARLDYTFVADLYYEARGTNNRQA